MTSTRTVEILTPDRGTPLAAPVLRAQAPTRSLASTFASSALLILAAVTALTVATGPANEPETRPDVAYVDTNR